MITTEQISELAKRWKIDQFSILREYVQTLFLFHLFNLKDSEDVYFKGGTSIRLLLNSFRFSEDLDFSSTLDVKPLSRLLENTLSGLSRELSNISMAPLKLKRHSLVSRIKFTVQELVHPLSVHLEVSLREKPIMPQSGVLETLYPISPYPIIRHLGWEEILAEKIRACLIRAKSRDLFDIWYLLSKETPLNWDLVNKKMAYYNKVVQPQELINRIERLGPLDVVKDLAKFLPATHRSMLKGLKSSLLAKLKESSAV
jgi:predicted nucleotidyltransferase component of viral defense system